MKWFRGSEEGDVVVRGGWAMAYQRPGLSDFTGVFGDNQGIPVSLQRDQNNTTLPILLRNNPTLPSAPAGALPALPASVTTRGERLRPEHPAALHPVVVGRAGSARSRATRRSSCATSAAVTRALGFDQPERSRTSPATVSSPSSGRRRPTCRPTSPPAAARRSPTPARGTAPLPILLAHFNAQNAANAGNTALYTGANWTSATFLGFLAARNPNPWGFATTGTNGLIGNTDAAQQRHHCRPAGRTSSSPIPTCSARHHGGRAT